MLIEINSRRVSQLLFVGVSLLSLSVSHALGDWPQFRGPNSSGIAQGKSPPIHFGPQVNELWSAPIGAGHSSPCVAGAFIFLTSFDQDKKTLATTALDRLTGKILWERTVSPEILEKGHPSFNPASSSPTSDGQRVVSYFGSYGLVCYDFDGNLLWEVRMPLTKSYAGNATSPAIIGNRVILYRGNYVDHFIVAFDKSTGKELWKIPQSEPFEAELACTACPIAVGNKLIIHSARSVQAIDIANGEQIWVAKCATTATSTPVIAGSDVVVAAWNKMGEPALRPEFPSFSRLVEQQDRDSDGKISRDEFPRLWIFHRPDGKEAPANGGTLRFARADTNKDQEIDQKEWSQQLNNIEKFRSGYKSHGILAIPINSKGILAAEDYRILETQGIPEVPSPLFKDGHIYFIKNGGILTCLSSETGERIYRTRTKGTGTHYASPVLAGNNLYSFAGNGIASVASLGPNPRILATNDMTEPVYATPAIAEGVLFVRTHSTLYAFAEQ